MMLVIGERERINIVLLACYLETVVIVVKDLGCDNKTCK